MSDHAHNNDDDSHAHGAHGDAHAAQEEHAHAAEHGAHEDEHDAHTAHDAHSHAADVPINDARAYPTRSVEAWTKRLKSHFPAKREALTPQVRNLVDELNSGSAWSMLKRSKELASTISKHHLVEPGSAVASEFPPGWDNLNAIRTTHKFVKIRNNGDLIFKKDTFWTRMEHRARHVAAAFGFLGFRPLMKL